MKPVFPIMVVANSPSLLLEAVTHELKKGNDLYSQPFVAYSGQIAQFMVPSMCLYEYRLIEAKDLQQLHDQVCNATALGFDFMFSTVQWNGLYLQWMCRMNEVGIDMAAVVDEKFQIIESAGPIVKMDINERAQLFANQLRAWNRELRDEK